MTDTETSKFSGHCLCGSVSFEFSAEPEFPHCCHCDDCRRASGSVYGSFVYVSAEALQVTGEMRSYAHQNDQSSTMTKYFCPSCGSHIIGTNSKTPERRAVWVGVINDASWFKPEVYFYASRKLPHAPVDPEVETFDKMWSR
jgi:hypothetical protein